MRDEFLNGELFDTLTEAQVLTRRWVYDYNTVKRPRRAPESDQQATPVSQNQIRQRELHMKFGFLGTEKRTV